MNLGYMMIPQQCICRAELARNQGFSEFYTAEPLEHPFGTKGLCGSSEQFDLLRVVPDLLEHPTPHVAAIDGQQQVLRDPISTARYTAPCQTPDQVKSNLTHNRASLSVSWLPKAQLARHWAAHVTGSTHLGRRARSEDWHVARTIVICDDPARAEAAVKSDDSPCRPYYRKFINDGASDAQLDALIDACVLHGTTQSVLEALHALTVATGPFGTLTLVDHSWPDTALAEQSIASLATAIAPVMARNRLAM